MRCAILCLGLILGAPLGAAAHDDEETPEAGEEAPEAPPQRWDYSRFSDGPRNVPVPRGAASERAATLGLGTREAAAFLMRHTPRESWTRAVRGDETTALLWPVDGGRFGRGFGFTRRLRPELRHNGVDILAPSGNVVRAVADGIVAYSDNGVRGFGNCVVIVHRGGLVSLYGHNQRTTVQPGWRVTRGERIALVGSTGISHGPHVHFELRQGGHLVDPMPYFRRGRAAERDEVVEDEPDEARGPAPAATVATPSDPTPDTTLGTAAFAERVLRHGADEALRERAAGRIFSTLLWPVRGGRLLDHDARRGRIRISSEAGTAVRAAADGIVIFASDTRVVIVHRNGWVTTAQGIGETAVRAGDVVERGAWIGRTAGTELTFELHSGGDRVDPRPLLAQVPPSP